MNLKGKTAWITGASSGIGESLALCMAKKGCRLILSGRRTEELNRVAQQIISAGYCAKSDLLVLPLDLEKTESFNEKVKEALSHFSKVDVLINNGGISQRSLAKDTDISVDRKLFEVNYFGTVALTKALLPHFIERKDGMIAVVTSAVGKFGSPWRSSYSASKHALHGFFDSLRAELHEDNIRILLVCPGFVKTNVSINALTGNGEKLGTMDTATADGLTPDECASAIVRAIENESQEVVVGGIKERFAVFAKRFFPSLFAVMIRKMAVR